MKQYEKLKIELIVCQANDVLTGSGEYEGFTNLTDWFGEEGGTN